MESHLMFVVMKKQKLKMLQVFVTWQMDITHHYIIFK